MCPGHLWRCKERLGQEASRGRICALMRRAIDRPAEREGKRMV